jgi:hypothetical protein
MGSQVVSCGDSQCRGSIGVLSRAVYDLTTWAFTRAWMG